MGNRTTNLQISHSAKEDAVNMVRVPKVIKGINASEIGTVLESLTQTKNMPFAQLRCAPTLCADHVMPGVKTASLAGTEGKSPPPLWGNVSFLTCCCSLCKHLSIFNGNVTSPPGAKHGFAVMGQASGTVSTFDVGSHGVESQVESKAKTCKMRHLSQQ